MNFDENNMLYRRALQAFLLGLVVAIEIVADSVIKYLPRNHLWYVTTILMSAGILLGMWHLFRKERVAGILDLYLYDVLAQIFGWMMLLGKLNPPEPAPLPYLVVILTILILKMYFALGFVNQTGMVIGPFSYFQRKETNGENSRAKYFWLGVIFAVVVSYYILTCLGYPGTVWIRVSVASFWILGVIDFLRQHKSMHVRYQDAVDEQRYLMVRLAELEGQLHDQQEQHANDAELLAFFNNADPAYRKLALKLLHANLERNEELKRQEALRAQGVFTIQGYNNRPNNDGHWQQGSANA